MVSKLDEIKAKLAAATQGKWEWRGSVAPNWMPNTWSAVDDLRVQIATPEKEYDADLWFVLQAMKSGFIMVRNADAELIANAPDYLRSLIPIVEAALDIGLLVRTGGGSDSYHCPFCGVMHLMGDEHRDGCEIPPLLAALKALE